MKKLLVSTLALVFAVAPAMAQDIEKSVEVSVVEQFQMVGDLGSSTKIGSTTTKKDGDVYFQNKRMRFGAAAEYGILGVEFVVAADDDLGSAGVGLDTAVASLNFMDEVALSLGRVGMATRGNDQSSSATMGINSFLDGGVENIGDMGIKLSGLVAGGIFEYALTLTNGNQYGLGANTVSGVYGPAVGLQLRFNLLGGEDTGGDDYFLGEKSAMTIGFSFVYQKLPDSQKYVKFKGTTADQENYMFFDVFLQGDVALGDNSLPFMLVYEHFGFTPDHVTATEVVLGKFTAGVGFYAGALKIMPAIRYSVNLYQLDSTTLKSKIDHNLEVSLGYFPYGNNLNLKIGYVYANNTEKGKASSADKITQDHKLITQVQMAI